MNLIAGIAGEVSAVAAVASLDKAHLRVGDELGARLRQQPDERIVLSVQNQCWNRNPVHHAGARRAIVVVVGVAKAPITGHDLVVELANRTHRTNRLLVA